MKQMILLLAALLLYSLAFAQESSGPTAPADKQEAKAEKKEAKAAQKGKSIRLTGWVKNEGGKTVFVNDKDKETWNVENADAVSGHEGHHVRVKAKINEQDHSLNIESVKMMAKRKQAGEMKNR
jgi:hypothetical protein